jgi:glycosidase
MKSKQLSITLLWIAIILVLAACGQAATPLPTETPTLPTATNAPTQPPTLPPPTATLAPTIPPTPVPVTYPWWNERVFYEIFVRSFYDSNADGNGDFIGMTQKLDYLNDGDPATKTDLGIGGVWLMPIFAATSYHGYDVIDYKAVNPDFGTLDDFKNFLEQAHQRGIRVIIDWPLNHTSVEHPWFQGSIDPNGEYRDWYIWSDTKPEYVGPWGQSVWHDGPQGGYYYGVFWSGMPDLNYSNPEVVAAMQDVMAFWIEDVGVDGFRLDGARYIIEEGEKQADTESTQAYFNALTTQCKALNPECLMLGEVWTSNFAVAGYVKDGDLDMAFDFELASAYMASASYGTAKNTNSQMKFSLKLFPPNQFAPFLTNHDQVRVMTELSGNVDKAGSAAALLLSGPGVPFIYYGEEIGMTGGGADEYKRTPMQWSPEANAGFTTGTPWMAVNADYPEVNVETELNSGDSLLNWYIELIGLRNQYPSLMMGDTYLVTSASSNVYSQLRTRGAENLLVVINLSDQEVSDYPLKLASGPLSGAYQATVVLGHGEVTGLTANAKGGFDDYLPLPSLPAHAVLVIKLEP